MDSNRMNAPTTLLFTVLYLQCSRQRVVTASCNLHGCLVKLWSSQTAHSTEYCTDHRTDDLPPPDPLHYGEKGRGVLSRKPMMAKLAVTRTRGNLQFIEQFRVQSTPVHHVHKN